MNENAQKWVEVLRNTDCQQGQYALRSLHDEYCCLGIATQLYHEETGNGKWVDPKDNSYATEEGTYAFILSHDDTAFLPEEVRIWLGLRDHDGGFNHAIDLCGSLSQMNDKLFTFEEIANVIEDEPEGLFL